MVEKIIQVRYTGLEAVPEIIRKRIVHGVSDEFFVDKRDSLVVAGADVPARTREVRIFDTDITDKGEHVLYAAIDHGKNAVTSVVSTTGPTREAAIWNLGRNANLPSLKEAYKDHSFRPQAVTYPEELSADGGY